MAETKKTGKTALRGLDGRQASGMCQYSVGPKGSEFSFSVQLPGATDPRVVLQYGPGRDYLCRPPEPLSGQVKCPDGAVAAVWVLDGGKPALFGMIGAGPFDQAEARKRLLDGGRTAPPAIQTQVRAAAIALPAVTPPLPPAMAPKPSFREPSGQSEPPFPFPQDQSGLTAAAELARANAAAASLPEAPVLAMAMPTAEPARYAAPPAWGKPLAVRRAPRPSPRPPVYSPLWDDVSAEFEKMLDNLPKAQPFNGSAHDAEIAEVPTGGAVQCYVGSVAVNGVKVYLQAVPARPFGRPAGFDHSLVSRDGECYWVKYFIQSD